MPKIQTGQINRWIHSTAAFYGKTLGNINYVFCSDAKILEYNKTWLNHDYYTDIITFDYSENQILSGDIYVGIETVYSNAKMLNLEEENELLRIIIHGILHLCGFKDKTPEDELIMHEQEDLALSNI